MYDYMGTFLKQKKDEKTNAAEQKTGGASSSFHFNDNRPGSMVQKKQMDALANYQRPATIQKKENNTGLPDNLKAGIENLSGYSMDDVKVHYNSGKPAQLNAHAYAQGTEVHIALGQEKHLPHEAWHVVQQKQGRVKPTMQMKGRVNINDDTDLEKEADVMGAKALQRKHNSEYAKNTNVADGRTDVIVQRKKGEIKAKNPATASEPVVQALKGRLTQEPNDEEIYLYDSDTNQSYSLNKEDLLKARVGDEVGYRIAGRHEAVITDWPGMDKVSKIILNKAKHLGIKDPVTLSLLMDFSAEEIKRSGEIRGQLKKYLSDWKSFTACYNTADSLFKLLAIGEVKQNPGNSIETTRNALINEVRGGVSHGAIIQIKLGIHGFVIMVRGGANVELLQSFAGESGEMFTTSLQASKSWTLGAALKLFTDMISNTEGERLKAQQELFGGSITDKWPPNQFTWSKAVIKSPDEIANDVADKLVENLKALKG